MPPWRHSAFVVPLIIAAATVCIMQLKAHYQLLLEERHVAASKMEKRVFTGTELDELLGPGGGDAGLHGGLKRERISIRPSKVCLSLTTFPPGAYITLDRRGRGHSPLTLKDLKPGRHLVEIRKPGYTLQRVPVDLVTDERLSIRLRKEPGPRFISIAQGLPDKSSAPSDKTPRKPGGRGGIDAKRGGRHVAGLIRDPLGAERPGLDSMPLF